MKTTAFKVMSAALFISLSINIFMAGTVVGHSASAQQVTNDTQDEKLRESLSDTDKAVLKKVMDAHRREITDLHNEIHDTINEAIIIARKEPMDEKSLEAVLEKEKKKKLAMIWLFHQTRQEAMKEMSPEGRDTLSRLGRLGFNLSKCH